ncbi:MAG: VanZ family protein [Candidatus Omnitrophica bacterium]|nr:VanZ family protein [Candidatus Omnitrophota bacterium]
MKLSRLTIFFGLFIIASASFMRQVLDFVYVRLSKQTTVTLFGICFVMIFLIIMWRFARSSAGIKRKIIFFVVLLAGFYFSWQLKILAERFHILEYGLLGYLAGRDLFKESLGLKTVILLILVVAIFAFLDEGFQYFLPYRVYDARDIIFNLIGGLWGAGLFLIKKRSNPKTA